MKMTLCTECGKPKGKDNECACGSYLYVSSDSLIFENETVKCGCGSLDFTTVNEARVGDIDLISCFCDHCGNEIVYKTYLEADEVAGIYPDVLSLRRVKDNETFYFDDITVDIETHHITYLSIHSKPDELGFIERYRYDFEVKHWRDMFLATFNITIEDLERVLKKIGLIE